MQNIHRGFLLSRHSYDYQGQSHISLWLSTPDGPAKLNIIGEQPVFFAAQEDRLQITYQLNKQQIPFHWKPLALKTFAQAPVAGVYFQRTRDYYDAQKALRQGRVTVYENDFRLHERYLMERFIYGSLAFTGIATERQGYTEYHDVRIKADDYQPALRMLSLDIECSEKGELFSIGFYNEDFQQVLMIGAPEDGPDYIHWIDDEKALLIALQQTIQQQDPDVIIGWNVINFDCRLLLQRAEKYGLTLDLGRDGSAASWRDSRMEANQGFITIAGRMVVDGIDALRAETYNFPSFSLESVAQTLLGRGKKTDDVDNRLEHILHDFKHNKPQLAAYNLEDCKLVLDIFHHTQVLDFLIFRSKLTGLELNKIGGSVAAFTNLYLPHLHRAGYIAPNLPEGGGLASPGGYVMDSNPGLYRNVLVLDYKSLYPSIIRTFKIDPLGLIEGLQQPDNAIPGFKGACFSRDKHFLPDIITHLWQQRDEAKRENDKAKSNAIKIIMNSFYGVLGSGGCRFYDPRLASSITLRGHSIMLQTREWIEAMGHTVIYGDTDSIFVLLEDDTCSNEAQRTGKALAREINGNWQHKLEEEFSLQSQLEMEFETHYARFLMPTIRGSEQGSKKRYAGLIQKKTEDGIEEQLIFKGLESVRTDWTELSHEFQQQLYHCVFHDEDPAAYVKQVVQQTLDGERDEQLVYRKRLRQKLSDYRRNIPPHARAAMIADAINQTQGKPLQYQNKGWIRYVITTQGPEPLEYQQAPLDYQHYIDKQLKPIADAVLPYAGLDFDSLVNAQLGLF